MNVAQRQDDPVLEPPASVDGAAPEPRGIRTIFDLIRRPDDSSLSGRYALLGVWLVLAGFYAIDKPSLFLTSGTFQTIFGSQEVAVFLGMAALVTLAVGEFDLSVASNMGLGAILVPVLVVNHGWAPAPAIAVALAACVGVGLLNALIVVRLSIDPIITTLGMATFILGITEKVSGGTTVAGLSNHLASFANASFLLNLPLSFYYGLALAIVIAYVMRFTALGRRMAFVGGNREVARLAGVRVTRIRMGSYIVGGLLSGIGGVLLTIGNGGFDPTSAQAYLLPAFAAAFLGTAAIKPGRFNPIGTLVAIYFLATGITGLELLGGTGWVSDVFYGGALVLAIVLSTVARRRTLHRT
jgi:ribose transport system permease protein